MIIALSVWQERISPLFDMARQLWVVEAEKGREVSRREVPLNEGLFQLRAAKLSQLGVEILLCGAISRPFAYMLTSSGIRVFPFLSGDAQEVLEAYLAGELSGSRLSPCGCGLRKFRFRGGR